MDDGPVGIGLDPCHRAQAVPVGIDHAVGFQPCQPHPAEISNPFEVFQATVPAIENHALRHETAPVGRLQQQCPEMIVLGQGIPGLVVEPVIDRNMAIPIRPQQRDPVDALDHGMVLARPMPAHPFDFPGIRFIQRRIIRHQDTATAGNLPGGFSPQYRCIRFQPVQQTSEGIMRRWHRLVGLRARHLRRAAHPRRRDQKIDVGFISDFR